MSLAAPGTNPASNLELKLPHTIGSANQLLKVDGNGQLGWATDSTTDSTKLPLAGGTLTGTLEIAASTCLIDLMETGTTNHRIRHGNGNFYIQKISDDKNTTTNQLLIDGGTGEVQLFYNGNLSAATASDDFDVYRRIRLFAARDMSGHQMAIGQWDGTNHRIEGDANRPIFITAYNSSGVIFGYQSGEKARVDNSGLKIATTTNSGISGSADDLIIGSIGDSTDRGITLATTGIGSIRWADAGDNAMGRIQYSNALDFMSLHTSNAERVRIDSNGDLGLGIAAVPQDSGAKTLHIHHPTVGNPARAGLRLTTGTSGSAASNGGFLGLDYSNVLYLYNQENGSLRVGTNGTERFRITNSGIIGVNIASPTVGYGGDTGIHIHSSATSGTRGPTIHLTSGVSGTAASDGSKIHQSDTDLVIQNHENGGLFLGSGNAHRLTLTSGGRCGIGTTSPNAQIHSYTTGSDGLLIQTSSYTSYVWQIESSGNLFNGSLAGELGIRGNSGIGFSANSGSSAQFRIESDGDLLGTDTSISSISDSRVKKNVADYTYDLAKFKQLTPKTFDWINPDEHFKDTNVRGFLAQDVQTIDDYWIKETDSVNKLDKELIGEGKALSSKLGSIDAMYVSVINQLITKIETLETKVAALEAG